MSPRPSVIQRPAGDAAKQFQQAPVARPVDAGRSRDRHLDAVLPGRRSGQPLALDFRVLIHVPRPERRVFVRRRVLYIAMNADRTAVNHPSNPRSRSGTDQFSTAVALTARYTSEGRLACR